MATTTNYGWTTPDNTDLVYNGALAMRTLGSEIDTTVFNNSALLNPMAAGKNALINGGMDIWQRGTTSAGNAYIADRWYSALVSGTGTFAQETTVIPTNSVYSMKFTASATAQPAIYQAIEQRNMVAFLGKSVTVSAQVAASASAPMTMDVQYSTSVDNSVTGTWTSITATSGGTATPTSTTFVAISGVYAIPTTAKSLRVRIFTTSTIANAVVVYFANAQLELGSSATTFARAAGNIADELVACQRYYFRTQTGTSYGVFGVTVAGGSTTTYANVIMKQTMRTTPTSVDFSGLKWQAINNSANISAASISDATPENVLLVCTTTGATAGAMNYLAGQSNTAYVGFSAEL